MKAQGVGRRTEVRVASVVANRAGRLDVSRIVLGIKLFQNRSCHTLDLSTSKKMEAGLKCIKGQNTRLSKEPIGKRIVVIDYTTGLLQGQTLLILPSSILFSMVF